MYSYRSKGLWSNSILVHIAISGLLWLPIAFFLGLVVKEGIDLSVLLPLVLMLLAFALLLFRRAQTKIRLPELEVSAQHLVLNRPLHKRTVYNLTEIRAPRFFAGSLYFRHLGWPVCSAYPYMSKEEQGEIIALLKAGSS